MHGQEPGLAASSLRAVPTASAQQAPAGGREGEGDKPAQPGRPPGPKVPLPLLKLVRIMGVS